MVFYSLEFCQVLQLSLVVVRAPGSQETQAGKLRVQSRPGTEWIVGHPGM